MLVLREDNVQSMCTDDAVSVIFLFVLELEIVKLTIWRPVIYLELLGRSSGTSQFDVRNLGTNDEFGENGPVFFRGFTTRKPAISNNAIFLKILILTTDSGTAKYTCSTVQNDV